MLQGFHSCGFRVSGFQAVKGCFEFWGEGVGHDGHSGNASREARETEKVEA